MILQFSPVQCLPNVSDLTGTASTAVTCCRPADSSTALINLARMSAIQSSGRIADHMSSLISFPDLIPVIFFVAFQLSAIISPVSYQAPSSLQFSFTSFSSLPCSSLFATPLFPKKDREDLSQITAGQQKVSPQDDMMPHSLPSALASTHHTKVQPADYPPHNQQF